MEYYLQMLHFKIDGENILIDETDLAIFQSEKWRVADNGCGNLYIRAYTRGRKLYLHRLILGIEDSKIHVDHINGNGLDNRRENLRICSNGENRRNSKLNKRNRTGFK